MLDFNKWMIGGQLTATKSMDFNSLFGKDSLVKRYLLISIGFLSLCLGVIGIIVPIMPTTPFILLSAYCFYRSSQRFYFWLLNHRIFGRFIKSYTEGRGIDPKTKWSALAILWLTMGFAIYLLWHVMLVPISLLIIALLVSCYILILGRHKNR